MKKKVYKRCQKVYNVLKSFLDYKQTTPRKPNKITKKKCTLKDKLK